MSHLWPYESDGDGLTASGCARPKCHVIAICTQDWLTSGSVAMIISIVTASLSVGGGCLMVQGVLGTQAHQSNWRIVNKRMSSNILFFSTQPGPSLIWQQPQTSQWVSVWVFSTCPLFVAACWAVLVKMATDSRVDSSSLVLSLLGRPEHTVHPPSSVRCTNSTSVTLYQTGRY